MNDLVNLTQEEPMAVAREAIILTVVIIWGVGGQEEYYSGPLL